MAARDKRPICVATHRLFPETCAQLTPHVQLVVNETDRSWPRRDVSARCASAHAMIAFMPDLIDRVFVEAAPHLEIVAAALKGYDNIDTGACDEHGIWVSLVPDHLTAPTAELAIGLAIGLMRHVVAGHETVCNGRFEGWRPTLYGAGLSGTTVALLGLGRIGRAIAVRLGGFGTELLYHDLVRPGRDVEQDLAVRYCALDEIAQAADLVFVCLPLNDTTAGLIDAGFIAQMKPGAYLVNPSRGSVVDEGAIAKALANDRLAGYAADVFAFEDWAMAGRPAAVPESLLANSSRVLFTPHLGSATVAARRRIEAAAAENVLAALAGERPPDAINSPKRRDVANSR